MGTKIKVNRNTGIISTGDHNKNEVQNIKKEYQKTDDINWEILNK